MRGIFDLNERLILRADGTATTIQPTPGQEIISSGGSTDTGHDIGVNNERIYFETYVYGTNGSPTADAEYWGRSALSGLWHLIGTAADIEGTPHMTSFGQMKWVNEVYTHLIITGTATAMSYAFGDKG